MQLTTNSSYEVPPLSEWERLFQEAINNGFDAAEDRKQFNDLDVLLGDGWDKQL